MTTPGYFIDSIASQPWFRCLRCKYDAFSQESIRDHVRFSHSLSDMPEFELSTDDWKRSIQATIASFKGLCIGISLLTWNTREASRYAAMVIMREAELLAHLGIKCRVFWADNGSTDGTVEELQAIFGPNLDSKSLFAANMGQSAARNELREHFLQSDCDYWLMVDGDVEIIPYSSFAMARFLMDNTNDIGCIGMYCRNCTHVRDAEVATECRKIDRWMAEEDPPIAWTNYGMFRRSVIRKCKFEESGPFTGPGWGFEDDDFYFQMLQAGSTAVNTKYFRHMHRRRHSSVKNLGADFAGQNHFDRKKFLINKWKDHAKLSVRLAQLSNQTMPVLEY